MSWFSHVLCIYCGQPITFWDRLFVNVEKGQNAHVKCRVEPPVGQ